MRKVKTAEAKAKSSGKATAEAKADSAATVEAKLTAKAKAKSTAGADSDKGAAAATGAETALVATGPLMDSKPAADELLYSGLVMCANCKAMMKFAVCRVMSKSAGTWRCNGCHSKVSTSSSASVCHSAENNFHVHWFRLVENRFHVSLINSTLRTTAFITKHCCTLMRVHMCGVIASGQQLTRYTHVRRLCAYIAQ